MKYTVTIQSDKGSKTFDVTADSKFLAHLRAQSTALAEHGLLPGNFVVKSVVEKSDSMLIPKVLSEEDGILFA